MIVNENENKATPAQPIEAPKKRTHLLYLDGFRGFAALLVCFHHMDLGFAKGHSSDGRMPWFTVLMELIAHYAVDFFIVLSGYCLMIPIAQRGGLGDPKRFFKRRAIRILPTYYFCLIISMLVARYAWGNPNHTRIELGSVISHLLLLHNFNVRWIHEYNVFWSIATEWQIYFVFALLLIPIYKRFGAGITALVACICSSAPWVVLPNFHKLERACFWYVGLFALGMWAANCNFSHKSGVRPIHRLWLLLAFLIVVVLSKVAFDQLASGAYPKILPVVDTALGLATAIGLLLCTQSLQDERPSFIVRVFSWPACVWLGSFSYSFYLMHGLIGGVARTYLVPQGLPFWLDYTVDISASIALAILVSYVFYLFCERPFVKMRG